MLSGNAEIRDILIECFHVKDLRDTDWDRLIDIRIDAAEQSADWKEVWILLRTLPPQVLRECLKSRSIAVCTRTGWHDSSQVFRVGSLVGNEDISRTILISKTILGSMVLDEGSHKDDGAILRELGITDAPALVWSDTRFAATGQGPHAKWFRGWHERGVRYYFSKLTETEARPPATSAPWKSKCPAGWPLLLLVDGPALPKITRHFLQAISMRRRRIWPGYLSSFHSTNAYRSEIYGHPLAQLLARKGRDGEQRRSGFRSRTLICNELFRRARSSADAKPTF